MVSFVRAVLIIAGLYLILTNLYDMVRNPVPVNIGLQTVSVAIGGGLVAYGFNYKPVALPVDRIVDAVKSAVGTAIRETGKVASDVGNVASSVVPKFNRDQRRR